MSLMGGLQPEGHRNPLHFLNINGIDCLWFFSAFLYMYIYFFYNFFFKFFWILLLFLNKIILQLKLIQTIYVMSVYICIHICMYHSPWYNSYSWLGIKSQLSIYLSI